MFFNIVQFLIVPIGLIDYVRGMALPEYIKQCYRDDPNLNQCALEAAREAIPMFAQGDPDRGMMTLDPLTVDEIKVMIAPNDEGLKIVFKDNIFTGLASIHLDYLKFDLENKIITTEGLVNLVAKSQYELSGKLLFIPITGSGDATIKLKNTTLHMQYWYEHKEQEDGKIHWNIIKNELKYEVGRASFKLENLLNADKRIGDQINKLLNELWREIVLDVGPAISRALAGPVFNNLETLLEQVPYDQFMPEQTK